MSAFAQKQAVTALSTAEAVHIALCEVTKLIIWKRNLVLKINLISSESISVYSDNTTALFWTEPEYNSDSTEYPYDMDIQVPFFKRND